ncbi:MAG: clostripain-related cysteine peptidase, partial [Candidatus Cloacimonas sp.]|nr:clostripain-related cysteine peptidase [Candidatus Cloacimonadota bacterium]
MDDLSRNFIKNLLLLMLSLLALLFSASCTNIKPAEWTIMIYMAADNNLSEQAVNDIIKMEKAALPPTVNVIVQLDPNQYASDPQARRYKIKQSNLSVISSPVIEYLGEIDSGDYLTLADFVNWSMEKYPAERYALAIWSHGSGWTREESRWICPDNQSINQMSIANGAFRNSFRLFKNQIDILILDACHMQNIEVISEVYPYADYVIGSEEATPFDGFPYYEILNDWGRFSSTESLAKRIANNYIEAHKLGGSLNPNGVERRVACSVAKSAEIEALLAHLTNFSNRWYPIANSLEIRNARALCHPFNLQESDVDIKELFQNIYNTAANDNLRADASTILNSIERLFPAQMRVNLPDNTGTATIWYPTYVEFFAGSKDLYTKLNFASTDWLRFLQHT